MEIADLPIPQDLAASYMARGITKLYPPQASCVEAGLLSGKNLLIAIPTASGKTLVAEMAMHHQVQQGGKCLYIVPLRALASEKFEEFSGKGLRVGIATGDFDRKDEYLGRNDIIVATSEKVDSLLRNQTPWLADITLLVLDEVHLIDDPSRGATIEMVIVKLRHKNPGMQIIALSATIGNPQDLAGWLDAELVESDWRPVDLREGVFFQNSIQFADRNRVIERRSKYEDLDLVLDTVEEGGQCLVFVNSRKNAEAFAKRAASGLKLANPVLAGYADKIRSNTGTNMGRILASCVAQGAAFHHAGLAREERQIVEAGFRDGEIKVIASTPTLAAGLNLPARRVVVRDYLRFNAGKGMVPIPVREYRQMAGRAGRPHLDPYGEAVLIAKSEEMIEELFDCYINAPAEDVRSRCANEAVLCTHILSLIATRFARKRDEVLGFMDRTFYAHQGESPAALKRAVDRGLEFLRESEMITEVGEWLEPTEYGALVSRLYIDPRSAEVIVTAMIGRKEYTDIGLLQLLCSTPDMLTLYVRRDDIYFLDRFLADHRDELWIEIPWDAGEEFDRSLKTALLLNDWVNEESEDAICRRYNVGPGDIYGMVESIAWLIHASRHLAQLFAPHLAKPIEEIELRTKHGIKKELLPLIRLRGIGRVRARRLFNNGLGSIDALRAAGPAKVGKIVGQKIAAQVFEQLEGVRDEIEETGDEQSSLSWFG
ncbi:MAG TPA: ATP-dependent DNA helicase [Candidatus Methanoculleus thermohydrogenotrophicum]|nr:ATP-dependent DNA helicase [Candidatus Methanoculleus thermohydrogenotrophicum]HOB17744.1 ATP-dependent DNA helicase [Candidatus Methanoculleus thermohydrogenotrophicum]HPZ37897.1 ATP-dependent DNA helicase [Candidatus Methanoculleus thermohydrogenotrophicum]HQC90736.1 ATP-dependent DNA helicase [Candidatus Methanoculleus thermohydrogenotrophicum]